MLDQLSEIAGGLPPPQVSVRCHLSWIICINPCARQESAQNPSNAAFSALSTPGSNPRMLRRPMLTHLRQIDSIRDLVPFFSSVSVATYESIYSSGGNIDWDEVERGLLSDMFEPR
jgi:hypothetical protein